MTDETTQSNTQEATQNVGAAVAAGVAQALLAASPEIAAAVAASDPRLQAALLIAQALQPSLALLIEQFSNQSMTQEELTVKLEALKIEAANAHNDWLASLN